jgi:hypothetical protein
VSHVFVSRPVFIHLCRRNRRSQEQEHTVLSDSMFAGRGVLVCDHWSIHLENVVSDHPSAGVPERRIEAAHWRTRILDDHTVRSHDSHRICNGNFL